MSDIRKYVNRNPRGTRDQLLDDIVRALDQQIDATSISEGILAGTIQVGPTPVEAKLGAEVLAQRHSLEIINDSSFLVYFGFSADMEVGVDTILINSGSAVTLSTNPNVDISVWVVSPDINTEIKIIETS